MCNDNPNKKIDTLKKKPNFLKTECEFCKELFTTGNINRHKNSCYLNPVNLRLCKVCDKPIKDHKISKGTCSYSCSNIYFSASRHNPGNYTRYTTICFAHHEKKCVVCGEDKIVAVHHLNENRKDNRPENLIPLCPTHHHYVHSRYSIEVQPYIDDYLKNRKKL